LNATSANIPTASHTRNKPPKKTSIIPTAICKERGGGLCRIGRLITTIAFATCVYAFFAIRQWKALTDTVRETKRLAGAAEAQVINLEKTLSATEKAANAAKVSADAALRSERPVLVVEKFIPHNIDQRMGPQGERTTFVKFGLETAVRVQR